MVTYIRAAIHGEHNKPSFCRVVLWRFMFVHTSMRYAKMLLRLCNAPFPSSKVAQHQIMDFLWLFTLAVMHAHNASASAALSAGENMTLNISSNRLMALCGDFAVAL
jgi:hypothetical protein